MINPWLRRLLGGLVVLVVPVPLLVAAGGWFWLSRSLPASDGTVTLPGLTAPVAVVRDRHAVPHIFARTDDDAYFALGYVHAQDRLWQMDMMRRAGAGRLSEVLGDAPLRIDRAMRTFGFHRLAEASYAALAPEVQRALDAYAAGVNAWLSNRSGPLPIEFQLLGYTPEPWTPADSLVWGKLMAYQLSSNYRAELLLARLIQRLSPRQVRDLFPETPPDAPTTLAAELRHLDFDTAWSALPPPLGPATASNEWVLAGTRTTTGTPILANDPHLGLGAPILWYLTRIETPDLHLAGATVPGVPFHILGHNDAIAWGLTTTGSDVQDLFVERIDPADPARYQTSDGSEPFQAREEVIAVKGGADVHLTVRATRHGPVISDIDPGGSAAALPGTDHVLALAFPAFAEGDTGAEAVYRLNRARDWPQFQAALRLFRAPQQNIVYADTAGNIGFLAPAWVPVRKAGDGRLPVPGWTGAYDWTGFIPFDALPRAWNPASGRIVNANNAVVGPDYPHFLTAEWEDHYRAARLHQVLDSDRLESLDSTAALQMDDVSLPARELLPLMLPVQPNNPPAVEAVDLLRRWDGRMRRDRPEPLIFEWWLRDLNRALYADELGPLFPDAWRLRPQAVRHMLAEAPEWCNDVTVKVARSCADVLRTSLDTTLDTLRQRHGDRIADWRWSREHRAPLTHQVLSRVPLLGNLLDIGIDTDGGAYTVNRGATWIADPEAPFAHTHGAGFRGVYDLGKLEQSRFIIATGQSGNPLSPHYGDLVRPWRDGQSVTLAGSRDAVAADGLGTLVLQPKGGYGP